MPGVGDGNGHFYCSLQTYDIVRILAHMGRARTIVNGELQCTACQGMFDLNEFHTIVNKWGIINFAGECHPCRKLRLRLRNLHMSLDEYWQMMWDANSCCSACHSPNDLVVDHEHGTGRLRSILCGMCNRTLGQAKEDPERLRLLANYIEHYATLLASRPPTPQDAERERRLEIIRGQSALRAKKSAALLKRPDKQHGEIRLGKQFSTWSYPKKKAS